MKNFSIKKISDLNILNNLSVEAIFIELPIFIEDLILPYNSSHLNFKGKKNLELIVDSIIKNTRDNQTVFIYGSPVQLIEFNNIVNNRLFFHYWIALDANTSNPEQPRGELKHNHLGVLLYSKNNSISNLDVKNTRVQHISCLGCGKNVKDWGGKKHLMNIHGTGLSDVWKDLYRIKKRKRDEAFPKIKLNELDIKNTIFDVKKLNFPTEAKKRILSLTNNSVVFLNISTFLLPKLNKIILKKEDKKKGKSRNSFHTSIRNKVILGDSIREMEKLSKKYPEGIFDMVFADPPYNLSKDYKEYNDARSDEDYEKWCNRWLELIVKLTKDTGSIFILNIPRWSLSHAKTLNKYAYLRNWIVWDALSMPKGKIMPAHYSLLYYTKSPTTKIKNNLDKIDSIAYCLRPSCKKLREKEKKHFFNKMEVSDIWYDIFRIKHKKDRDDHPCQLPHKLMNRIIDMSTEKGDFVLDPFGGAGTTGIVAKKKLRDFLLIEVDPYYKEISEKWLKQVEETGDTPRNSIKKSRNSKYTKKFLETRVQELSLKLKRKPTIEEFIKEFDLEKDEIMKLYDDPKKLLKAGRVTLLNSD